MNGFFYFKVTFVVIFAGLFTGTMIYGLFDIDLSNSVAITKLFLRSLMTAFGTGLILGLLNMFFKVGNFQKRQK